MAIVKEMFDAWVQEILPQLNSIIDTKGVIKEEKMEVLDLQMGLY